MIRFNEVDLPTANLVVDAVYGGTRMGNASDDPLGPLLGVSNSGGFRYLGQLEALKLVVLTSRLDDPDWPDALDVDTGTLTYYGDNKRPGCGLHETPRKGNQLLSKVFSDANGNEERRARVPPIFAFFNTGDFRDVRFVGLVVPGVDELAPGDDLVAIWRSSLGERFQNYRARFAVLDVEKVSREWLKGVMAGTPNLDLAPPAWQSWVKTGRRRSLRSTRSIEHRRKAEQLPSTPDGIEIIRAIQDHFSPDHSRFEHFAGALARLLIPDITTLDITRPSRDGGRDGIGCLRIGSGPGAILVDFALEAKCYGTGTSVGVRDMSRLISRLRHRQFGVLVTTSYVDDQAYREIKEDGHPIVVVAAADILAILKGSGRNDRAAVQRWLDAEFKRTATTDVSLNGTEAAGDDQSSSR